MEKKHYFINEIFLHVTEAGPSDGKKIIFLHGFPDFWYGWKNQITYFVQKGFKVIVPDQRGYNLSDKPHDLKQYELNMLIKDIVELIQFSGSDSVYLVGHDWGGTVAFGVAALYPSLVSKLIILNGPHPYVIKKVAKRNIQQMLRSWYILFFQIPFLPEILLSHHEFSFLKSALQPLPGKGIRNEQVLKKYVKAWSKKRALSSMLNWYRAAKYMKEEEQMIVACPVLILWGKLDSTLLPKIAEENLHYCIDGQIKYFDDATHWIQHEKVEEINDAITQFILDEID